jgi:hypothetical protein
MTKEERFWSKVDIKGKDECWEWKASTDRKGYGQIGYPDRYSIVRSHRVAWELTNGPIPDKMLILHKCDNSKCNNPNHLYCGTHSDNICDAITRNRGGFRPRPKHDTSINTLVHTISLLAIKERPSND